MTEKKRVKVFLLCSGLGRVQRGFESFTRECFNKLSGSADLDVRLFKGFGPAGPAEVSVFNLARRGVAARCLARVFGQGTYFFEQVSFAWALIPHLVRHKPDVLYFSDAAMGRTLWYLRARLRQDYRLVFSNGGPFPPHFPRWDHVQQLTPVHYQEALAAGEPEQRMTLLPYGFDVGPSFEECSPDAKAQLRTRLGLPLDRKVILSVASISTAHKRLDYLIRETAALEGSPFLVMLGDLCPDSAVVKKLASECLGPGRHIIRAVPQREVVEYYRAADVFVLTSLEEAFGRVFLEALAEGLPCLAHDYEVARHVLGEYASFGDFRQEGSLSRLLGREDTDGWTASERHAYVHRNFGWDHLLPEYASMLLAAGSCQCRLP